MSFREKIYLQLVLVFCCFNFFISNANAQLYINELMASNSTTIVDESGDFDDWIEIYNAGSSDVNLAGYYISDDPSTPSLWQIPATNATLTTVPAGSFLLLWADKDLADGANHINLKLSSGGETLALRLPDGNTLVDAVSFGAQNTDVSYGRVEDGMSYFQNFPQSTPGVSNSTAGPSTYPATFVFPVSSYSDDAEEAPDGTMKLNSPDLDMTNDGTEEQTIGIRFTDINIEQGASITNAYIQFTTFQASVGVSDLTISGQDDGNPSSFTGSDFNISNRSLTSSSINWSPNNWLIDEENGDNQKTSNLSNIVQELIDKPSWNIGNAMAFIIEGSGVRGAYAFDGNTELVPQLVIEIALPAPSEPVVDLYINEVAARGTDYADEQGDFEDWVELYNGSNDPIAIGGLYLTDDTAELLKWQIGTSAVIQANDHLIIWTDSDPEEGPLHTNFKLSGSGGTLSLVQVLDNAITVIDQITFGDIPLKASYGRETDGDNTWVTFGEITPDAPNDGADLWITPPSFSLDNGAYTGAQTLSLSHPASGVEIRYTTNGSDPTEFSSLYNNPITISNNQAVKAIAVKSGYANSRPSLRSYLIDTPLNLPTLFLTSDPDNFFSDETGIYVVGTNGVPGYCDNSPRNFANDDWERPANLTLFETDGTEAFNVNVGVQIGGACSRNFDLKGLNIYLREKEYGDDNLNYQLYKGRDHDNYYRFKLRNSGQDFIRMGFRDGLIQTMLWDEVDLDLQGFQPTVMYLNGEYWGIHNIRENYNDEYFETNYDVKSDEIDLIKSPALSWQEVKKGDDLNYMSLFNYIDNNDLSAQTHYDYVEERIDMNEFTNYWITMGYTANYDWPANNIIVWRERKSAAKWRWAVLDTDGSTANGLTPQADFDFNTLAQITDPNSTSWPNHQNSTLFLRGLLENEEFRDEYIQRNCSFMELVFNPDRVNMMTDSIQNMFLPEVDAHIAKWGSGNAMGSNYWSWLGWVDAFREFFEERPTYFRGFMDDYFNLDGTYELSVIYDVDTGGDVFVNRNAMDVPYDYVGTYFKGIPMRVSAVAKPGFTFSHWLETGETTSVIDFVSWTNTTLTPIFTGGAFIVNLGVDMEICAGESISLDATIAGCNDCTYLWEDNSSNPFRVIFPASTSSYSITVTNGSNQSVQDDITISVNESPNTSISSTDISCYGAENGTVNLSITNGSTPYEYDWSNQANTQNLSGLNAGTYSVTVTDDNGCTSTESIDIIEPDELNFSLVLQNDISCFNENDGSININVSSGTSPYSFSWNNGATTEDISNLASGSYTITITESNNCETIESFTIDEPAAINLTASTSDLNCFASNDGDINLSVNGGTGSYNFIWSNGAASQNIMNLTAGSYIVTVTDANLCESIETYQVLEPTALLATPSPSALDCFNDTNASIELDVNGGTAPYSYLWNTGASTQNIDNLSGGIYAVTITDNNDCEFILSNIQIDTPNEIVSDFEITGIDCFGETNAAIQSNISGGNGNLTYLWNTGATTSNISNLSPGTYTLSITDITGCELIESVTIVEPAAINIVVSSTNINCSGETNGAIDLSVDGGNEPYTFTWSNGAITEDISNLSEGTFLVTITDNNACQSIESFEITAPTLLTGSTAIIPIACFGDNNASIEIIGTGGTAPYAYLWSTGANTQSINNLSGGTFAVTMTDNNGCEFIESGIEVNSPDQLLTNTTFTPIDCTDGQNGSILSSPSGGTGSYSYLWNTGATTPNLFNLGSGTYTLTITDAEGCEVVETSTLINPTALSINQTTVPISCNGFSDSYIDLSVSGGTGAYTFIWNTGATIDDLYNLGAGFYEVSISDANGCQEVAAYTITEPDGLDPQTNVIAVSCEGVNNGSIQTNPVGGTPPYNYSWNTGATTQNLSNLTTGGYMLTLTDANNCQITNFYSVNEVDGLFIDFVPDPISCFGANDATLTANVSGGTGVYTYLWNTGATTETIENLSPGFYQLTVVDNGNCEAEQFFEVIDTEQISATTNTLMAFCGNANGSIAISPEGGTAPYTYLWNTGATTPSISNLSGGTYELTLSDLNGCQFTLSETVTSTDGIELSSVEESISCFGTTDGSILLNPMGGNGNYSYIWSNGASSQEISDLAAGIYSVTVSDSNDCETTYTVGLNEPDILSNTATVQHVSCFENSDGAIELSPIGGTDPYSFVWSNGSTLQNISELSSGTYFLTITDANGCEQLDSFSVTASDSLNLSIETTQLTCYGYDDASIALEILSGGTAPFNYNWSNGATASSINNLAAGFYEVSITDANECLSTEIIEIIAPGLVTVNATVTDPTEGVDNGLIEISASGGTAPYTYLWNTGATSSSIDNLPSGTYTVEVIDANNCIHIASYTLTINSIDDLANLLSFDIYPNPSDGQFQVVVESNELVRGTVTVYNVLGQIFFNRVMEGSRLEMEINLKGASTGIYFVQLEVDGAVVVQKVVVDK